ncbi:MAG: response regulator [Pseudomonadota bacterium]
MGGEIGVRSRSGEGSTFWFRIPMHLDNSLPEPTASSLDPDDLANQRILVADGSALLRPLLQRDLRAAGARVVMEEDSASLRMRWSSDGPFDGVVVHHSLLSGLADEAVTDIFALTGQGKKPVPLLVIAPQEFSAELLASPQHGVTAVVAEPVSRRQLVRAIRVAVGLEARQQAVDIQQDQNHNYRAPDDEVAREAGAVILIAEDNPTNQIVIAKLMSRLGYICDVAPGGPQAWDLYNARRYGLMVTDCHMPEMDGYDLTQKIRLQEDAQNSERLPIVALTADAVSGAAEKCLAAGMDDYITKPIDMAELDLTIQKWLPSAATLRSLTPAAAFDSPAVPSGTSPDTALRSLDAKDEDDLGPVFDPAPILSAFGQMDQDAKDMLGHFISSTRPLVEGLAIALSEANLQEGIEAAHAAKGAANMAGAIKLGTLCGRVEDALNASDLNAARVHAEPIADVFAETVLVMRAQ